MEEPTTFREEARAQTRPRRIRLGTFSSLRHVNFRYLWFGTLFMSGGQWIQHVTLGWLLYDLTGSSILLGVMLNVFSWTRSFPMALLALIGIGIFQILYMATTHTLLQVIVPDQLRGRIMTFMHWIAV